MSIHRNDISVTVVTGEFEFMKLRTEWNNLSEATIPLSVFLRHEWFDAAWQWLKSECSLYILCFTHNNVLIGIAPLIMRIVKVRGFHIRSCEFLSIPDTQECDVLARPGDRTDVVTTLCCYLGSKKNNWDRLDLSKIPATSPTIDALAGISKTLKLRILSEGNGTNPGLSLQGTWEAYYGRRSRRLKKGNNHIASRLARSGTLMEMHHITRTTIPATENIESTVKTVTHLSSRSWKHATGLTLDHPGPAAFLQRLTESAFREGWLSIWTLTLNEQVAAMEYQIVYNGVISALRADYDPQYVELSPGSYLNWKLLEKSFQSSERYYQMGPGDITYKMRWAEEYVELRRIAIFNGSLRGRLLGIIETLLRPAIKRVSSRFRNTIPQSDTQLKSVSE